MNYQTIFLILSAVFVILLLATGITSLVIRTPYVPTKKNIINKLLDIAKPTKKDYVIDLGCGDGRLLFAAEKNFGCIGIGYEIAPLVFLLAILRKIITGSKSKIYLKNFFSVSLNQATIIFCYLSPHVLKKLAPKFKKDCKSGTKIISHTFHIEGLTPIKTISASKNNPVIYIYEI